MIHCLATPFIFVAQATVATSCSDIAPGWWKMIDVLFLGITFVAIYFSSKTTPIRWMPRAFYLLWSCFALLVVNNFLHILPIPHAVMYIPAISLSILHLYNRRQCQCVEDQCCVAAGAK